MTTCCESARSARGTILTRMDAALTLPCVPPPTVVKRSATVGSCRTIDSTSRATASVAWSDAPGAVLIAMLNWLSSACGRNSTPTNRAM